MIFSLQSFIPFPMAALGGIFLLLQCFPAFAQNASKQFSYDSYKVIRTRNIFDPDRKPNMPTKSSRPSGPGVVADYVALTGVLMKSDKALAFFSGPRPEYNKVLSIGGEIAGATITKIHPSGIEVQREGKTIAVGVGQTVPFDDSAPVAAPAPTAVAPSSSSASQTAPSSRPSGGNREEIMRRMMERRQKELK